MLINFEIPNKLIPFFESNKTYQVLYGGRSSAKTATVIRKLIVRAMAKRTKILCTREYQSSISDSTYAEIRDMIFEYGLHDKELFPNNYFKVTTKSIICANGSEFIFKGLRRDIMQIKSIPGIDIVFIEEAETISRDLWEVLDPTIRKDGSQMIICFNPRERLSSTYQIFIEEEMPEEDIIRIEINYPDNPFNSPTILKKIERMKINDYPRYEHIYLGKVIDMTEDVIFKGKVKIMDMDVKYMNGVWVHKNKRVEPLYGMDFGYSTDPAAIPELFFLDEDTIYINREIYETKLLPRFYKEKIKEVMPEALKQEFSADEARPDTIAELRHMGLNVKGAPKGKGSVESGIEWLLGKNIIINPSCVNMIYEAHNYKWKIDKLTGKITTEIIDANNHLWDAIRYACHRQIRSASHNMKISQRAFNELVKGW